MKKIIHIEFLLLMGAIIGLVGNRALAGDFALTGEYYDATQKVSVTIKDDHKIYFVPGASITFPNRLMSTGNNTYRTTGALLVKGGNCTVPVRTLLEFDEMSKIIYFEMSYPRWVLENCSEFQGERNVFFEFVRISE